MHPNVWGVLSQGGPPPFPPKVKRSRVLCVETTQEKTEQMTRAGTRTDAAAANTHADTTSAQLLLQKKVVPGTHNSVCTHLHSLGKHLSGLEAVPRGLWPALGWHTQHSTTFELARAPAHMSLQAFSRADSCPPTLLLFPAGHSKTLSLQQLPLYTEQS